MGGFSLVEYLKDPNLVARFQRYLGVLPPKSKENINIINNKNHHNQELTSSTFKRTLRSSSRINLCKKEDKVAKSKNVTDCDYEFDKTSEDGSGSEISEERLSSNDSDQELKSRSTKSNVLRNHHTRNESSGSSGVSSSVDEDVEEEANDRQLNKLVSNKLWYYLFKFGTALGDEVFYACWFSFWFWNVDGAVGRRVVLLWAILMYIGQGLKDIIRWPRPSCPPVVRLEKKWEMEYGMPSTHAVVGAAVPFSTIIFTASRYQYPIEWGVIVAVVWCSLVCTSRIYLGMHSVLDIVAGLSLVGILFVPVIPLVDWLDPVILKSDYGGLGIFLAGVILCFLTPGGDRWTPARGDTFVILGSCVGLTMGAWLNYQLGVIRGPPLDPPYAIIWPSYSMLGLSLLRLVIGLCMVVATRAIVKSFLHMTFHSLLKVPKLKEFNNATKKEVFAELSQKFLSYVAIGMNVVFLSPAVFRLIGIERPTFHTEV